MTSQFRARVCKVLANLCLSQKEDKYLDASVAGNIRYYLWRYDDATTQVEITGGSEQDDDLEASLASYLPRFLLSQIDAQNIANGTPLWTEIAPILGFIQFDTLLNLIDKVYPTVFTYYSRQTHRTYHFFALTSFEMKAKYSARELLSMQQAPIRNGLNYEIRARLQEDSELSDIIRSSRARRLARIPEETPETSGDSGRSVASKRHLTSQLDGTEFEWKYRGRLSSEEAEIQPIPAPTGLTAQKDEGFQRFYKAVVSPTHVRVTAGGRIVPNTRGSSPTTKWARSRSIEDNTNQTHSRVQADQASYAFPQPPFGPYAPLYPGCPPGMNPGLVPGGTPYAFVPWFMGMNMSTTFPVPQAPLVQPSSSETETGGNTSTQKEKSYSVLNSGRSTVSHNPTPAQVQTTKPVWYNREWMMAGPVDAEVPDFAKKAVARSGSLRTKQSSESATLSPLPVLMPDQLPLLTSTASHVSSIRPSDITKRHVEILKTRLKYLQDQLQYNRHQIDEDVVQNDAQQVLHHIRHFQDNLEAQLSAEIDTYPTTTQQQGPSQSPAKKPPKPSASITSVTRPPPPWDSFVNSIDGSASSNLPHSKSSLPIGSATAAPFQPQREGRLPGTQIIQVPGIHGFFDVEVAIPSEDKDGNLCWDNLTSRPLNVSKPPSAPYLVGELPNGVIPELASDTDYLYDRELTEDELRARHMYWGRAPRHLQKGLPKYDGKNFYPASPMKGRSSNNSSDTPSSRMEEIVHQRMIQPVSSDPFHGLGHSGKIPNRNGHGTSTQSEFLARQDEDTESDGPESACQRPTRGSRQLGRSLDEITRALCAGQNPLDYGKDKVSSDDDEEKEIVFTGRKGMSQARPSNKIHSELWPISSKKSGKSSAYAVPGTISSTTVHGVLPNYSGYATASLAPSLGNVFASSRSSMQRTVDAQERRNENCPPNDSSLKDSPGGLGI